MSNPNPQNPHQGHANQIIKHFQERKLDGFDPLSLKRFSPLMVQLFIPESVSSANLENSNSYFDFMGKTLQYYDLYCAMEYAEQEVMPQFTVAQLDQITPEKIIEWIKAIHQRAGKTLLSLQGIESGQYCDELITRWEHGGEFSEALTRLSYTKQDEKRFELFDQYGINREEGDCFWQILDRYSASEEPVPQTWIRKQTFEDMEPHSRRRLAGLHRLAQAFYDNKLTTREREVVSSIVMFGMPLDQIPTEIETYARELLEKMKSCQKNKKSICDLVSWSYQKFTHLIHPFPNANGRTGTIFAVNCVLNAFKLPCILLRTPDQKSDPTSLYSLATAHHHTDRKLLTELISTQLEIALRKKLKVSERQIQFIHCKVEEAMRLWESYQNCQSNKIPEDEAEAALHQYFTKTVRPTVLHQANVILGRPSKFIERLKRCMPEACHGLALEWKFTLKPTLQIWVSGLSDHQAEQAAAYLKTLFALSPSAINTQVSVRTVAKTHQRILMFTDLQYSQIKMLANLIENPIIQRMLTQQTDTNASRKMKNY